MYAFTSNYRVRYADVDQMGFMYYGNYAKLFEIGRVEALRNLGIRYRDLELEGIWMPVYENTSRYLKPAKYDDDLRIVCKLETLPKTRIEFICEIFNEEDTLIHVGKTSLVFLNSSTSKVILCPDSILEKLNPYFNDN